MVQMDERGRSPLEVWARFRRDEAMVPSTPIHAIQTDHPSAAIKIKDMAAVPRRALSGIQSVSSS